ncbi:DNA/RNA helicase, superfamily II, SNF2 family [Halobacteroides halobius DSM 5150]|uniref:DNA/RNA helicase, superfamily II, SNF2 family n=1 Tax=Halobacteroides halobius (strain ATCC 35273 / DSM 5150 / MD-1) TaxID=748449 RepID=L0KAC5_HALHC|nr:SNF2-related protein [Halobacteroides halobius]AGB41058.1 DNA/RNA helicase, superfamily II, SNF2 family [Halobacteroides halobius DSM 5150]
MALRDIIRDFLNFNSEEKQEFVVNYSDDKCIKIFLHENNQKIEIDPESDNIFTLLSMTNLELAQDNSYLKIDYDQIYDLYFADGDLIDDYKMLGLPDLYQGYIKVDNVGNFIQDEEVKYSFYFEDSKANYDICIYKNNIVQYNQEYRVLQPDIYELITSIRDYNKKQNNYGDMMKQFEVFGKIKDYADENNILLNSRLSNEEKPIIVDEITIDFDKKEDGLEIYPKIEDKDDSFNQDLVDKFDRGDQVRNFYNVDDDGIKRKVIFKNKDSAKKIKENRSLSGEDELKFYKGENELWEDENLDLSNFGPRVRGFGYLNYRANAISDRQERDDSWFDAEVETEIPKVYSQSGDSFKLKYKDREKMADKLRKLKEDSLEVIDVGFTDNEGKKYNMVLNEDQLKAEINKINQATINIDKIKNIETVKNIKELVKEQEDKEVIKFDGRFIRFFSLEYLEDHLTKLEKRKQRKEEKKIDQEDEDDNKEMTTIIEDNLEKKDISINPNIKDEEKNLEVPSILEADLYPHQKVGVRKLQFLYKNDKVNGLLLADDMGLGKTLQLLTFIAWIKEKDELNRSLVVAPTTLINDWDNNSTNNPGEIQKFFPNDFFNTYKIRGRIDDKEVNKIKQSDIVFTSYNSLRINNIKLGQIHWNVMVCDEAQKVKNATTQTSVAVKAQNADFKIACTATPIENNLLDLWNIMDYAVPGILNARTEFKRKYVNKLSKLGKDENEQRKRLNNELTDKIDQNFLRRNKKGELDDLPKKKIKVYGIPANQNELNKIRELNQLRQQGENHLPLIQKLVALCSHISLIDKDVTDNSISDLIEMSSKLKKIKAILDPIKKKNEKVLIFTVFKKMQKILIETINYWYGFAPSVLNGDIAQNKRQRVLDNFRKSEGFNVIILSPEVAGVGIDLVEANHVIHYTRLWNPAKEDQATDRAYRIGQKKDVSVYYPILTLDREYNYKFESEVEYINRCLTENVKGKSPEEKLNKLLVNKKNLLLNFFFAAGDSTIDWNSIADENEMEQVDYINIGNVSELVGPYEFEILVAKLYEHKGYKVYPTIRVGDNGVDVVAIKNKKITLIQCKQLKKNKLSGKAINEVYGGRNLYSNSLNKEVEELVVVTTADDITSQGENLAKQNNVNVILKQELANKLVKDQVYYSEIDIAREERYSIEKLKRIL